MPVLTLRSGDVLALVVLIAAERLKWPDGAVEACDAIEAEYPGWSAYYATPITPDYGDPGFYGRHEDMRYPSRRCTGLPPTRCASK